MDVIFQGRGAFASYDMPRSPDLRRLLANALSNTLVVTQGVREVVATRRGSRVGEADGGVSFSVPMRRILRQVHDRMEDVGLAACLPVPGDSSIVPAADEPHGAGGGSRQQLLERCVGVHLGQ